MGDMKRDLAKLALATAMRKELDRVCDPKADGLRRDIDDAMRAGYECEGTTQRALTVGGQKVGTISARLTKEKSGVRLTLEDMGAFEEWLLSDGREYLDRLVAVHWPKLAEWAKADGVVPDGCGHEEWTEPQQWAGTTVRVDAQKVADALGAQLPSAIAGLMGGGDE